MIADGSVCEDDVRMLMHCVDQVKEALAPLHWLFSPKADLAAGVRQIEVADAKCDDPGRNR